MKGKIVIRRLAAICIAFVLCMMVVSFTESASVNAASDMIQNDTFWKDTDGNPIYSQGGGVFQFGDTYYWYGVHYGGTDTYAANPSKKNSDTSFVSVTCYSSKDLVNWKFENDVLTPATKNFGWCYWFGRMGVAYNQNTKKYVLVAQYNESIMFATCDTPTGDFAVDHVQDQITNVLKQGTGDQTVFVDDDGKAYLICSNKGGRAHLYVSELRESDFLNAEPAKEVFKGSGREGNCMFKHNGKYYFCASDLHGWNASHSYYMVADNIWGPYSEMKVMPGTDEDFSHVTQTGFFYTVKGTEQETVIFCGDRWSDFAGNGYGFNQWCPLSFDGDTPYFNSLSQWHLDAQTGEWHVGEGNNYILNPSYEADRVSQQTLAGWKNSGSGNSNSNGAHSGNFCMQQWSDSAFKGTMSQDVTLPNGTYTLKAWAKSSGGQNDAHIYISGYGGETIKQSIKDIDGNWKEITISDIPVTTGSCQVGIYSDGNAGNWVKVDDFSLIGKPDNTPSEPEPMNGKIIQNLIVADRANVRNWSIQENLQKGDAVFGDRTFRFTQVPDVLQGAEWIRTACDSKKYQADQASFTVAEDAVVFIGVDSRLADALPAWLNEWTKTDDVLTDDGNPVVTYEIYKKNASANSEIVIGVNGNSSTVNYLASVKLHEEDATETTEPEEQVPDLNGDGQVNAPDAKILQDALLCRTKLTVEQAEIADLNGDGQIDVFDLVLLKRAVLKNR